MNKNRYVAAWNELKNKMEKQSTESEVITLGIIRWLEEKHGIPNKEVQNAGCKSEKK